MAQPSQLVLTDDVKDLLARSSTLYTAMSKMCVYFAQSTAAAVAKQICEGAVHSVEETLEMEIESFLTPVVLSITSQALQDVLVAHFDKLRDTLDAYSTDGDELFAMYPYGFLFVNPSDLANDQAIIVHCDEVKGRWLVGSCTESISSLAYRVNSLVMDEEFFADILRDFTGQDQPAYEVGRNTEDDVDRPMFALFSTGMVYAAEALYALDADDEDKFDIIFDPDTTLYLMSWARMVEIFPETCARISCNREYFVCVDNEQPTAEGVLVVRMAWDGNTEDKSVEELRRMGRESPTTTMRCSMHGVYDFLVRKIKPMTSAGAVTDDE